MRPVCNLVVHRATVRLAGTPVRGPESFTLTLYEDIGAPAPLPPPRALTGSPGASQRFRPPAGLQCRIMAALDMTSVVAFRDYLQPDTRVDVSGGVVVVVFRGPPSVEVEGQFKSDDQGIAGTFADRCRESKAMAITLGESSLAQGRQLPEPASSARPLPPSLAQEKKKVVPKTYGSRMTDAARKQGRGKPMYPPRNTAPVWRQDTTSSLFNDNPPAASRKKQQQQHEGDRGPDWASGDAKARRHSKSELVDDAIELSDDEKERQDRQKRFEQGTPGKQQLSRFAQCSQSPARMPPPPPPPSSSSARDEDFYSESPAPAAAKSESTGAGAGAGSSAARIIGSGRNIGLSQSTAVQYRPQVSTRPTSSVGGAASRWGGWSRPEVRTDGVKNLGNTCYLSAVLQSLLHLPSFVADLLSPELTALLPPTEGLGFYRALVQLSREKKNGTVLNPHSLKEAIGKHIPQFANFNQQDAHEFLIGSFDQLDRELKQYWGPPERSKELVARLCPVTKNFELEIECSLRCLTCGDVSRTLEIHFIISVDIPDAPTKTGLDELLEAMFKPEERERKCEKCSGDKAEATFVLVKLPRVLVIHLKRFVPDASGTYRKNSRPVSCQADLDLEKYTAPDAANPTPFVLADADNHASNKRPADSSNSSAPEAKRKRLVDTLEDVFDVDSRDVLLDPVPGISRDAPAPPGRGSRSEEDDLQEAIRLSELEARRAADAKNAAEDEDEQLRQAMRESAAQFALDEALKESATAPACKYGLRCIVRHRGATACSGHYIAIVRVNNDAWKKFDDSISQATQDATLSADGEGYLYFYVNPLAEVKSALDPLVNVPTRGAVVSVRCRGLGDLGSLSLSVESGLTSPDCPPPHVVERSSSKLSVSIPPGSGTAVLHVRRAGTDGEVSTQIVYAVPTLTRISPAVLPTRGGRVVLEGENLGPRWSRAAAIMGDLQSADSENVRAPGLEGPVGDQMVELRMHCGCVRVARYLADHQSVEFDAPEGVGAKQVVVCVGDERTNPVVLRYKEPEIFDVTPFLLPTSGAQLCIRGDNFGPEGTPVYARLGGRECRSSMVTIQHTEITCFAPAGHGTCSTLELYVGGQTCTFPVAYLPPRVLSVSGDDPSWVTLFGENFSDSQGSITVIVDRIATSCRLDFPHATVSAKVPVGDPSTLRFVELFVSGQSSDTFAIQFKGSVNTADIALL
eukprot:m51a1_g1622 putative ubiquitin carboxyl-terminal hydrolase 37 isoform x1 (1199) ;mRNA; f:240986-245559